MMQPIIEFFQSDSVLALAVAATIFLITVILVAKRFIGFMITLLLLAFSIAAGYAVLNHDLVEQYLQKKWEEPPPPEKKTEPDQAKSLKDQILRAVDEIKRQLTQEKQSISSMNEELEQLFEELKEQKEKLQSSIQEKKNELKEPSPDSDREEGEK